MVTPILAAGMSFVLVISGMQIVGKEKQIVLSQKAELQALTVDLRNLDGILADEQTYGALIQKVTATLPGDVHEVASAVFAIERTARDSGLPVELAIDEKPKSEGEGLESLTMAIKTAGSYTAIRQFLTNLSHLPYHTSTDAIVLDGVGGNVIATITIRLFMQ